MFGVSIGPPYEDIAENPTSSSTAYTTFGAPSGAFAGSNGDQSGTESRMSTLILPLNGLLTTRLLSQTCDCVARRRAEAGDERDRPRRARSHGRSSLQTERGASPSTDDTGG